jgi:hypothetical protein
MEKVSWLKREAEMFPFLCYCILKTNKEVLYLLITLNKQIMKGTLIIMDNSTMEVHTYPTKMGKDSEYYETELHKHGHNDSEVSWMVAKEFKLINH